MASFHESVAFMNFRGYFMSRIPYCQSEHSWALHRGGESESKFELTKCEAGECLLKCVFWSNCSNVTGEVTVVPTLSTTEPHCSRIAFWSFS